MMLGLYKRYCCSAKMNNNNNNSYTAVYPVKVYKLAALYIINIKIRLTTKKVQVNAYINIKMTKEPRKKTKTKCEEEAQVL